MISPEIKASAPFPLLAREMSKKARQKKYLPHRVHL